MKRINATILEEIIKEELFLVLERYTGPGALARTQGLSRRQGDLDAAPSGDLSAPSAGEPEHIPGQGVSGVSPDDPRWNRDEATGILQPTKKGFSRVGPGADPRHMPGLNPRGSEQVDPESDHLAGFSGGASRQKIRRDIGDIPIVGGTGDQDSALEGGMQYTDSGPLSTTPIKIGGDNTEMLSNLENTFSEYALKRAFELDNSLDKVNPNLVTMAASSLPIDKQADWIKKYIKGQNADKRIDNLWRKTRVMNNRRTGKKMLYDAQVKLLLAINNLEPDGSDSEE